MEHTINALNAGEPFLTEEQNSVVNECMQRDVFGLSLPMGQGKCEGINTPHIMFDGSIKMVQDIQVGDLLMGDDSKPRKVLSLARGRDTMYKIIPQKGEIYTFNSEHILCIVVSPISKDIEMEDNVNEVSIKQYLKMQKYIQERCMLYRVPVDFPPRNVPMDPYIIGVQLGNLPKDVVFAIPNIYKINSREIRLRLLAGILDSTKYKDKTDGYLFTPRNENLMNEMIYVARSLGFSAHLSSHLSGNEIGVIISGNTEVIPCKNIFKEKQVDNILTSNFEIIEQGEGDYYGFEIDGNNRYLLGDFTVTHNTILSLIVGLKRKIEINSKEPILVIASKSLLGGWEVEINKFFGNKLVFQIMNVDSRNFILSPDTMLVLVTSETAAKFYKENMISEYFVTKEKYIDPDVRFPLVKNVYDSPTVPYLRTATGGSIIYQKKWSALIIDEGHKYTNITTNRCQALGAICSKYRFILSGTLFDEPDFERILGYYVILHWNGFPKDLPEATNFLNSSLYRGTRETMIERSKIALVDVKVNKHIIQHDLSEEEGQIYISMKKTLDVLRQSYDRSRFDRNGDRKKFSTYLLAMLSYLRQSVVVPLIPIANIALEMSELSETRSELSVLLMRQFDKLNLQNFLDDESSAKSTRIKKSMEVVLKHNKSTDKIIVFSCFCTSLDMLLYYVNEEIPIDVYKLSSNLSVAARSKLISDFQTNDSNSILFTTFELGSEGLNLQCANVVIILDFWWNSAKTQQAIARVVRNGQKHKEVDIYFFTSNTGIEKALFAKQHDKIILLGEIKNGSIKHVVKTLKMSDILRLINTNENYNFLSKNYRNY